MGASAVKYSLFFLVFLAMVGAEIVLNQESVYDGLIPHKQLAAGDMVTGNVVSEEGESPGSFFVPVLIILFIIVSLFAWLKRKSLWIIEHDGSDYGRLVLRIMLGIVFMILGFEFSPTFVGYALAMLKLILGVLLIVGLFTRPVAFVGFFYFLSFFAGPFDLVMTVVLLGISLCVILLGAGVYSIDYDLSEKRRRPKARV
jgi:uncharacterized membrane protein YphA (DoxX/SURF4 family)